MFDMDKLVEDEVLGVVREITNFFYDYSSAVDNDETVYIGTEKTLSVNQSKYIDSYGDLKFLFLLVDDDIYCRIDKKSSEYELYLYKRMKGFNERN